MVTYLEPPYSAKRAQEPLSGRTASGYGNKLPTQYMVRAAGKGQQWRRVYCICHSNVGSLYVAVKGERRFLREYELDEALERAE